MAFMQATGDRTVYHVVHENGKWKVKKAGSRRASSTHRKKTAAVRKAKRLAKRQKPSQVIEHRRDGTVMDEQTYTDDPFPPKG